MIVTGTGVVEWVARKTNEFGGFGYAAQGIGWRRDGEIIAGVVYADWNGPNIVCHTASDGSRRWLNRQFLAVMFDYPFIQLGVERVTLLIGEGNKDSSNFAEHLGFELETTLERAHKTGNLMIYRMFKEACKWISQDFSKRYVLAA